MALTEQLRLVIDSQANTKGFKDTQTAMGLTAAEVKRLDAVSLDLSGSTEKVDKSLEKVAKAFDEEAKTADESTSANKKNAKSFIDVDKAVGGLVLGLVGLQQVAKQAGETLGKAGAEAGIRTEFQRLAVQANLSANEVRSAMENVAQGTISAQKQMAAANKLFLSGMDITADQIGQLMAIARDRAIGMGISVDQAFDDITRGITRNSPLILDNLGIIVKLGEENEVLADKLGIAVEDMSAQQKQAALLTSVLENNADAMERVSDMQGTTATNLAIVTTNWENLGIATRAWLTDSEAAKQALDFLNERLVTFTQLASLTFAAADGQLAYNEAMHGAVGPASAALIQTNAYNEAMRAQLEATGALAPELDNLSDDIRNVVSEFVRGKTSLGEFEEQYTSLSDRVVDPAARQELEGLLRAFSGGGDLEIGFDGLVTSVFALTEQYGMLADSEVLAASAANELAQGIEASTAAATEAADITAAINEQREIIKQGARESRVALVDEWREGLEELADEWLDTNEKIAGFDDDLQRKLAKTALQGTQKRQDIQAKGGDRRFDINLKEARKIEDIETKFSRGLEDDQVQVAGARLNVHRDFWRDFRKITRDGGKAEGEAIRDRDARALTDAENQSQEQINDITESRDEELQTVDEGIVNKQRSLETARRREIEDANTAQQRGLQDSATTTQRALQIQQTGEQRSIAMQTNANMIKIEQARAAYAQEEADYAAHFGKMAGIARNGQQQITFISEAARQSTLNRGPAETNTSGAGRILSGSRGRRNVR